MTYKQKKLSCLLVASVFLACGNTNENSIPPSGSDVVKEVAVNADITYQTIDGFSASDCWTGNFVGRDWADDQKESIARLFFSREIKNGSPEGIGLSMWRFNLGAGTSEQGDASDIEDVSRRAECILQPDGSYNWNSQRGQQFFLEKARDYGCQSLVMFSNSPPVYYTYNGKGYSDRGSLSNLKDDRYDDFAGYMADVADYFKKNKNINFSYISPVNEPQYNWEKPSQEGSAWRNSEIKRLVVELDKALTARGLDTKILITEAGDWEYLYKEKNGPERSNQIAEFFSPNSENYIGGLSHVDPVIGAHSYWTDGNWNTLQRVRSELGGFVSAYEGLKIYQTEWSFLGDHFDDKYYPGHETSTYQDIALYMSQVMHHDLTVANVNSWSFWTSMDVERWGHKNRFLLITLEPPGGAEGDISQSGTHYARKNLWALGNYSLFIRPGFQRVNLSITNPSNAFFGSAWISPERNSIVVVYTNMTTKAIEANTDLKGINKKYNSLKRYVTSETKDLQEDVPENGKCIIDPQSVTTFVYSY